MLEDAARVEELSLEAAAQCFAQSLTDTDMDSFSDLKIRRRQYVQYSLPVLTIKSNCGQMRGQTGFPLTNTCFSLQWYVLRAPVEGLQYLCSFDEE